MTVCRHCRLVCLPPTCHLATSNCTIAIQNVVKIKLCPFCPGAVSSPKLPLYVHWRKCTLQKKDGGSLLEPWKCQRHGRPLYTTRKGERNQPSLSWLVFFVFCFCFCFFVLFFLIVFIRCCPLLLLPVASGMFQSK